MAEPSNDPPAQPIHYADLHTASARTGRSASGWMLLLMVWAIGLIVWTIYLVAIGYLLIRVM